MSGGRWRSATRWSGVGALAVASLALAGAPAVLAAASPSAGAPVAAARSDRASFWALLDRQPVARAVSASPALLSLSPAVLSVDLATGSATAGLPVPFGASVAAAPVPAVDLQRLPADGIPAPVLKAYRAAADREAVAARGCGLTWPLLAAIGRVESDHGRDVGPGGGITPDGTVLPPILGPVLDGTGGTAAIPDGAGWARAVGPMQFLTSTWAVIGADGNGDGRADANNVYDASLAAARYLCAGGRHLTDPAGLSAAVYSYNHSDAYVQLVLGIAAQYAQGDPGTLGRGGGLPTVSPSPTPTTTPTPTPRPTSPRPTSPPPTSPPPSSPPPTSPPAPVVQTISFPAPAPLSFPGAAAALSATGGGSGLPVTFTAGPARVCRVAGGSALTPTGPGICSVTAAQAGAAGYLPADPVSQAVPVGYLVVPVGDLAQPAPIGPPLTVALTLPGARPDRAGRLPAVTATGVDGVPVVPPDGAFVAGADGTYRWTLVTRGLAAGPHTVDVTIAGDPTTHQVAVVLR